MAEYEFDIEQFADGKLHTIDEVLDAIALAIQTEKEKEFERINTAIPTAEKVKIADIAKKRLCKEYPMLKPEWIDAVVNEQMWKFLTGKHREKLDEASLFYKSVDHIAEALYEVFGMYMEDLCY